MVISPLNRNEFKGWKLTLHNRYWGESVLNNLDRLRGGPRPAEGEVPSQMRPDGQRFVIPSQMLPYSTHIIKTFSPFRNQLLCGKIMVSEEPSSSSHIGCSEL